MDICGCGRKAKVSSYAFCGNPHGYEAFNLTRVKEYRKTILDGICHPCDEGMKTSSNGTVENALLGHDECK
jgi:hypothetical protein